MIGIEAQKRVKSPRATAKVASAAPAAPKAVPVMNPLRRPTRFIHIDAGNAAIATPIV
jgi:hypothetical protein